jgi:hypothetical protein
MYWPASGLNSILDYLRLGQGAPGLKYLQTLQVGLLAAAPGLTFGMDLSSITESTFPGYARENTTAWTSGAAFSNPYVVNDGPAFTFNNMGLLPAVVFGAFLRDTFDLIAVDLFASAVSIAPGRSFIYSPEIKMKSLSP